MTSNYAKSKSELRKIAVDEVKKQLEVFRNENCEACQTSMGYQAIATVMWILHRDFGFGAKRLNDLKDHVEDEFQRMENGIAGLTLKHYSGNDFVISLKKLGVDLEASQYGS